MQWREAIFLAYIFNKTHDYFEFVANQFVILRLKGINGIMRKKILTQSTRRLRKEHKEEIKDAMKRAHQLVTIYLNMLLVKRNRTENLVPPARH